MDRKKKYFGKYRGRVKRTDDPLVLGRITAVVPDLFGDEELPWAYSANNFGKNVSFIPKKDDFVWIEFEQGQINRPLYTATWGTSLSTRAKKNYPQNRVIETHEGLSLEMNDAIKKITVTHTDGPVIEIDSTQTRMSHVGGNEVFIKQDGSILLKSGSSQIEIDSVGSISIIGSSNISIQSSGIINIQGTLVNLG